MFDYLFKKLPPSISVPLFFSYFGFLLILRFLASVYGIFILALVFYFYAMHFTETPPLSFYGLLQWIVHLDKEYKVALLTSSVTVIGFVVAFHTATINWKSEIRAQMNLQAAAEIESFFSEVSKQMITIRLYLEQNLLETVELIDKDRQSEDAIFHVDYAQQKAGGFRAARDQLSVASIEAGRIIGKNYYLLSQYRGLTSGLEQAIEALGRVAEKMWVQIPIVNSGDPARVHDFRSQIDRSAYLDLLDVIEDAYGKVNWFSGGVRGGLLAPILGASTSSFFTLFSDWRKMRSIIKDLYKH